LRRACGSRKMRIRSVVLCRFPILQHRASGDFREGYVRAPRVRIGARRSTPISRWNVRGKSPRMRSGDRHTRNPGYGGTERRPLDDALTARNMLPAEHVAGSDGAADDCGTRSNRTCKGVKEPG
jgi:hypothetical protein